MFVTHFRSFGRLYYLRGSVIVGEALVEGLGESRCAIGVVGISGGGRGDLSWLSSDHHGDSDVVVVGGILGLVSVLSSDGLKGVVADDLSEGLQSNAVNDIESICWGDLEGLCSLLIDWNRNELRVSIISSSITVKGSSSVFPLSCAPY